MNAHDFFQAKLDFETDSYDVFVSIRDKQNWVVLDVRSPEAYSNEHIPGATLLHHKKMSTETTAHLDKGNLYVTYCDGIGCNASTKGAQKMAALGFQVKELLGGLDWWKRDGYATEGTKKQEGIQCNCD